MGLTPEKIRADQIAYGEAMSGESTRPAHDYVPRGCAVDRPG